jgi:hypothetical protein
MLIATFRCHAPALCGPFEDERRIVAGHAGGRVYIHSQHCPRRSAAAGSLLSSRRPAASHPDRQSPLDDETILFAVYLRFAFSISFAACGSTFKPLDACR